MAEETYTYRAGKKIPLTKRADQFVVRALPEKLDATGLPAGNQMSSASSRVTVPPADLETAMARARTLAPTHHAYERSDTGEEFLITDRVVVTFKEPPSGQELSAFAGRYGLVKQEQYSDREFLFQLTNHTGMNPVKLVVALTENEPVVAMADHDLNQRMRRYQFTPPTDPQYKNEWHLHTLSTSPQFDPRSSSRCEDAWRLLSGYGGPDVVVGLTDDGCLLAHHDLDSADKFAAWAYLQGQKLVRNIDIGADPASMHQAGADHGTACAGVIAGEADAALTVGAAPGCRLLPIKWESDDEALYVSDTKMRKVLDYIADKVDVLSNSWGSSPTSDWLPLVTDRIKQLAVSGGRRGRGIVFLWAAGNENCPIEHTASIQVPFTNGWQNVGGSWSWVGVQTSKAFHRELVGIDGVMHIAALASNAQRSHYSNHGTGIDLCAPSNNVHEYYRLDVPGLGIVTTGGSSVTAVDPEFGGTSSATPLVAGIAALVISANPQLTALEVISILRRTAAKDLNFQDYARTPPASYDPNPVWDVSPVAPFDTGDFRDIGSADGTWSPWFGFGRVDAGAAVSSALQAIPADAATSPELFFESEPGKTIPDNSIAGIKDTIEVSAQSRTAAIEVAVSIRHTWIGDLRVTLIAPDGTTAVLHDRVGSSQKDLVRTYDAAGTPQLAALNGKSTKGVWMLQVQDTAAQDTGTLDKWSLRLTTSAAPLVVEEASAVKIPDNDPNGIVRQLQIPAGPPISDITVGVDITHPWVGDLLVSLTPPIGPAILLHNRAGGSADNLIRVWRAGDLPGLQALQGQAASGTWQLKVADTAARDEGKLNRWRIEIS